MASYGWSLAGRKAVLNANGTINTGRSLPGQSAGHGPRRCLGGEFGRLDTMVALSMLVARFRGIELAVDPGELWQRSEFFLRRVDAFLVVLGNYNETNRGNNGAADGEFPGRPAMSG